MLCWNSPWFVHVCCLLHIRFCPNRQIFVHLLRNLENMPVHKITFGGLHRYWAICRSLLAMFNLQLLCDSGSQTSTSDGIRKSHNCKMIHTISMTAASVVGIELCISAGGMKVRWLLSCFCRVTKDSMFDNIGISICRFRLMHFLVFQREVTPFPVYWTGRNLLLHGVTILEWVFRIFL